MSFCAHAVDAIQCNLQAIRANAPRPHRWSNVPSSKVAELSVLVSVSMIHDHGVAASSKTLPSRSGFSAFGVDDGRTHPKKVSTHIDMDMCSDLERIGVTNVAPDMELHVKDGSLHRSVRPARGLRAGRVTKKCGLPRKARVALALNA